MTAKIKITQEIKIYEVDDKEVPVGQDFTLGILSHWNWNDHVIIVSNGKKVTVSGTDLIRAIQNAMNTGG
jgi:endonuclease V-like protein UPF0215 family